MFSVQYDTALSTVAGLLSFRQAVSVHRPGADLLLYRDGLVADRHNTSLYRIQVNFKNPVTAAVQVVNTKLTVYSSI